MGSGNFSPEGCMLGISTSGTGGGLRMLLLLLLVSCWLLLLTARLWGQHTPNHRLPHNDCILISHNYTSPWVGIDIDINVGDIRHRHLLFQYRKKICLTENCHSDIGRVPISEEFRYRHLSPFRYPISRKYHLSHLYWNPRPLFHKRAPHLSAIVLI
jgi:hypothetical protein